MSKRLFWFAVFVVLAVQAALVASVVHRESLTFDEDDHMFAGYMMWHTGDFGLNPEHPPLVKLVAALPLLGEKLWVPPLHDRDFKFEAYLDGRDWLAHNDGASQRLVFRMRLAVMLFALGLSLAVGLMAREFFGDIAGLIALILAAFEPNILANSGLVTTDIGASLFLVASLHAFYRYVKQPTWQRLVVAGLTTGFLLSAKHSGVLLAPMLVLLIGWEALIAQSGTRKKVALRLSGAFVAVFAMGVVVLWSFYGFRYAARPAGLALNPSLNDYMAPLKPLKAAVAHAVVQLRLLPESYLMGLIDVKRSSGYRSSYAFGTVYARGQWWYFPAVILIKSTLGMLALGAITAIAIATRKLAKGRELAFVLIPAGVYLGMAMASGMNIGVRHILPVYALATVLVGGGAAAMAVTDRRWVAACAILLAAHVVSVLTVFPHYMAYSNEAWGGPKNTYKLLSDSNVDWGQELYQVKAWQDAHPSQECWFAYFAWPEIDPSAYGIRCHHLPTGGTNWMGGADITPTQVNGTVLISASDLTGGGWQSARLNPYRQFQSAKPEGVIDYAVFAYRGSFDMKQAAALSRAENATYLLHDRKPQEALAMARSAVEIAPGDMISESALGDAAAAAGLKDEARAAWEAAIASARQMEPRAQQTYVPELQDKLANLGSAAMVAGVR